MTLTVTLTVETTVTDYEIATLLHCVPKSALWFLE